MAARLNKVFLIGRLGQDPRLAYLPSGEPVVNLSLATDESYTDRDGNKIDRTEWHRVVAFNKPAEFASQYLQKGRLIFVEGKIRTRKWQDQQGQDRYTTEIVAYNVQALDRIPDELGQPADQPAGEIPPTGASVDTPSSMPADMDDAPF